MKPPTPPRVYDMEEFWIHPPPEPSARLLFWKDCIEKRGWRPNRRIENAGYWGACHFFGVYLWEYLNVLSPILYGFAPPRPVTDPVPGSKVPSGVGEYEIDPDCTRRLWAHDRVKKAIERLVNGDQ